MHDPLRRPAAPTHATVGRLLALTAVTAIGCADLPANSVLQVTFDGELQEAPAASPFAVFGDGDRLTLRNVTEGIRQAATDDVIVGLVLEIKSPRLAWAQLQEIEEAVSLLRANGKWSIGFLETAGEFDRGNQAYALAACADRILLSPPGDINLVALAAQTPFIKGALDRLRIGTHFAQRHEFKNAANMFTQKEMTRSHRKATKRLVDDFEKVLVSHIATRREVDAQRAREWLLGGPYAAKEALTLGLVDALRYWDEVSDEIREKTGGEDPLLPMVDYAARQRVHGHGPTLALIYGDGTVARGESSDGVFGSDTVSEAFRDAREDEVGGVLFRINSPGGSYIASDLIRREVAVTRDAGIPVVVSMAGVAASGGYFVAMEADQIFALPTTITGSIGVYAGTFATREFWRHWFGVSFDGYATGSNADFFSWLDTPTAAKKRRLAEFLDRIYDDFVTKAAAGRSLDAETMDEIARGRVWSGAAAEELGLVDALGGAEAALVGLKELAGIATEEEIELRLYPEPRTGFEAILEMLDDASVTAARIKGAALSATNSGVLRMATAPEVK